MSSHAHMPDQLVTQTNKSSGKHCMARAWGNEKGSKAPEAASTLEEPRQTIRCRGRTFESLPKVKYQVGHKVDTLTTVWQIA